LVEQRTENPRVGGSIPSLAIRSGSRRHSTPARTGGLPSPRAAATCCDWFLLAAAVVACYIPTRRATRTDAIAVLRRDQPGDPARSP